MPNCSDSIQYKMKRLLPKKKKKAPPKRLRDVPHAEFEYALQEYNQTVRPTYSNDDGLHEEYLYEQQLQQEAALNASNPPQQQQQQPLDAESPRRTTSEPIKSPRGSSGMPMPSIKEANSSGVASASAEGGDGGSGTRGKAAAAAGYQNRKSATDPKAAHSYYYVDSENIAAAKQQQRDYYNDDGSTATGDGTYYQTLDTPMPDTMYEEHYGDAYVGAPIKYVYPSGYQSMRPRGGPWKLSIAICVLFTWLSVFIVGHCSDRNASIQNANEIDDDNLIETKWCGSRLLYFMWVMSMLITGLSAAYCSVIGYIKMRDFAVANQRSQPPGMVGKSDYYVTVDDVDGSNKPHGKNAGYYQKTIYQSDGTPQFWGGHIYRPTQAAVAITSR